MDLLIEAVDNDVRLNALASMTRPGLDYVFFQNLSDLIDKAADKEKEKLTKLRERLLEITKQIDEQLQTRLGMAQRNLETLLQAEKPGELLMQNPEVLDDFFVQVLNQSITDAQEKKDKARTDKLQGLANTIQQLITPGYNPELLNSLLEAGSDEARKKVIDENKDRKDKELAEKVRAAYRAALRVSMEKGMQAPQL
jgi:hypothetical protein